ncbi:MAG: TIGR01458 family HAD-type hydrolase [Hyphomicrobiaceae bacterium]
MPISGVLLDLAGVVYEENRIIPGSLAAIEQLRARQVRIRFVTNTTRSSKDEILRTLEVMGLGIASDELFTPIEAARNWLATNGATPHLLVHPAIESEFSGLPDGPRNAVVVGDVGHRLDYIAMNAAFRTLLNGADLIALAKNRSFRDHDGKLSLDAGPFVAALEFASNRIALVLGKPSPDFFKAALASMQCLPHQVAMVGDDAESDVAGAINAGIGMGILVRTGKYRPGDEERFIHRPTATVADLSASVDFILSHLE